MKMVATSMPSSAGRLRLSRRQLHLQSLLPAILDAVSYKLKRHVERARMKFAMKELYDEASAAQYHYYRATAIFRN